MNRQHNWPMPLTLLFYAYLNEITLHRLHSLLIYCLAALSIFEVQKMYRNSCITFCTYYMPVKTHLVLGGTHVNFEEIRGIVAIVLMDCDIFSSFIMILK